MKLDTARSLICAADAVSNEAKMDVYKAARSVLKDITEQLETLIKVAGPATDPEEDE
jgi:hypothetical protein